MLVLKVLSFMMVDSMLIQLVKRVTNRGAKIGK